MEGLTREATTFYDYVLQLAFDGGEPPEQIKAPLKRLMLGIVGILQNTIGILDFWKKPVEVRRLRGDIETEILAADIPALNTRHERIAVEIVRLAEKRNEELLK